MTGRVETADGKVYELPALLEWRLRRTGGVPCDSFRARCLYSAEMGEALKAACRFAATENGVTRFRGVIDEWSAVCGAEGAVLTVEGRGMAALLLDNEAEAVTYQRAALSEILKDHAAACGVTWEPRGEVYGTGEYAVAKEIQFSMMADLRKADKATFPQGYKRLMENVSGIRFGDKEVEPE